MKFHIGEKVKYFNPYRDVNTDDVNGRIGVVIDHDNIDEYLVFFNQDKSLWMGEEELARV